MISRVEIASILCSISQSNPRGAAHERSGNPFRGGVSPRFTRRPEGQSTVEYVLVIAIIALAVLIAGPWVSSAIGNQFNLVAGTFGNGIDKGGWESGGTGGGSGSLTDVDIVDPVHGTAFAVYSEDDRSLMFYKRKGLPKVGDMLKGRRVTEVYPDIENYNFDIPGGGMDGNAPWWPHRADILSVKVIDSIKPKKMSGWFYRFVNVTSIDLGPIDTSEVTSLFGTFDRCVKLRTLDVSMMDTSKVTDMGCAFFGDGELTGLDLSGWNFSNVYSFGHMFTDCRRLRVLNMPPSPKFVSQVDFIGRVFWDYMFWHCEILNLDCSDWNVPVSAEHQGFNGNAPGVIPPKVWQ